MSAAACLSTEEPNMANLIHRPRSTSRTIPGPIILLAMLALGLAITAQEIKPQEDRETIPGPAKGADRAAWLAAMKTWRQQERTRLKYDGANTIAPNCAGARAASFSRRAWWRIATSTTRSQAATPSSVSWPTSTSDTAGSTRCCSGRSIPTSASTSAASTICSTTCPAGLMGCARWSANSTATTYGCSSRSCPGTPARTGRMCPSGMQSCAT